MLPNRWYSYIYAADVNQPAAQSEDMDNEVPEKAKRGKKSKALYLSPNQIF